MNSKDEKYIKHCLQLAVKGEGYVSPNPLVGCVIVKEDKILSTGFHQKYGSFHAERNAILNAKEDLQGATLYCNLEPCMHKNKQTPPCVPLIISSGIKRVVVSNTDTNPSVKGKGIVQLKEAGIETITGVLENEGYELNKFYFKFLQRGIPYITLKIATSADGMITHEEGKQTWFTGSESKEFVHKLRSKYDAVLAGANTINIDNPLLTVREFKGRNPKRVIIDGKLSSDFESSIFNDNGADTFIFCSQLADISLKTSLRSKNVTVIEIDTGDDMKILITDIIKNLAILKINSVLVEGGKYIFEQFINTNYFDEVFHIKAPMVLSTGIKMFESNSFSNLEPQNKSVLGKDVLYHYKNLRSRCLPD